MLKWFANRKNKRNIFIQLIFTIIIMYFSAVYIYIYMNSSLLITLLLCLFKAVHTYFPFLSLLAEGYKNWGWKDFFRESAIFHQYLNFLHRMGQPKNSSSRSCPFTIVCYWSFACLLIFFGSLRINSLNIFALAKPKEIVSIHKWNVMQFSTSPKSFQVIQVLRNITICFLDW